MAFGNSNFLTLSMYYIKLEQFEDKVKNISDDVDNYYQSIKNLSSENDQFFSGKYYEIFREEQERLIYLASRINNIIKYETVPDAGAKRYQASVLVKEAKKNCP